MAIPTPNLGAMAFCPTRDSNRTTQHNPTQPKHNTTQHHSDDGLLPNIRDSNRTTQHTTQHNTTPAMAFCPTYEIRTNSGDCLLPGDPAASALRLWLPRPQLCGRPVQPAARAQAAAAHLRPRGDDVGSLRAVSEWIDRASPRHSRSHTRTIVGPCREEARSDRSHGVYRFGRPVAAAGTTPVTATHPALLGRSNPHPRRRRC